MQLGEEHRQMWRQIRGHIVPGGRKEKGDRRQEPGMMVLLLSGLVLVHGGGFEFCWLEPRCGGVMQARAG